MNIKPIQGRNQFPRIMLWPLLLVPWLMVGCKPLVILEQPIVTSETMLGSGHSVGQTFVAQYDGLEAIAFNLKMSSIGDGVLQLTLHPDSNSTSVIIRQTEIPLRNLKQDGYIKFQFDPISDSNAQYYYVKLTLSGDGEIFIRTAQGDSYLDGAQYVDDDPQDAQTAFRLIYNTGRSTIGIFREFAGLMIIILLYCFIIVLPGWGILGILIPDWRFLHWIAKVGLSAGVSLAIYPIIILWTSIVGLHLGALYAWLPPVAGFILVMWKMYKNREGKEKNKSNKILDKMPNTNLYEPKSASEVGMIFALALLILSRYWIIRGIKIPLFGDSYQHTLITQLMIDHGGLFTSWEPYAKLSSFTYHFGFHSIAAAFHWISGIDVPQTVLWTGQALNVLAVICLALLAIQIGKSDWAGVFAIIVAGLLSSYPNFYSNWGRYTQLAGQVVLPSIVYLVWMLFSSERPNVKLVVLTGFLFGGLALTHYRILILALAFLVVCWITYIRFTKIKSMILITMMIGSVALFTFLPWLLNITQGNILNIFINFISIPADQIPASIRENNAFGNINNFLPNYIWVLMFIAVLWGLSRREPGVSRISLWVLIILILANPTWLYLPGTGVINNFAIFIAAYIPAGILIGSAGGWLVNTIYRMYNKYFLHDHLKRPFGKFIIAVGLLFLFTRIETKGFQERLKDLKPEEFALVTYPDLMAGEWIQQNTPQDAMFLVDSFLAFGNSVAVGADAGWWLPLIAHRTTTLPPINIVFEQGVFQDYRLWVNSLTKMIIERGIDDEDVINTLRTRRVSYIYIGQQQGGVNNPDPLLKPIYLLNHPAYRLAYHQDRVWIFELIN